jgi:hypothetical protein
MSGNTERADETPLLNFLGGSRVVRDTERERVAALGDRLSQAFAAECAAHGVRGAIEGGPDEWTIEFAGQENASPTLMLDAFLRELRQSGVLGARKLVPDPDISASEADRAVEIFRYCARRMRVLLVEHNSYISGGLRYPFPASLPGLAERGLVIYRFPKCAEVDVTSVDDRVRIDFAPDDLGEVTSSGFYSPTLFEGDFCVDAEYRIVSWHPHAHESASFALFVQTEDASDRYYAQRMSTGEDPARLFATMRDQLSEGRDVVDEHGVFRIERRAEHITCSHSREGEWIELGVAPAPANQEMLFGAKIWSKNRCGGFVVDVYNLRAVGHLSDHQLPPSVIVADPRTSKRRTDR